MMVTHKRIGVDRQTSGSMSNKTKIGEVPEFPNRVPDEAKDNGYHCII